MKKSSAQLTKMVFAKTLTVIFFCLTAVIIFSLFVNVAEGIINQEGITTVLLGSINTGVIALAVFELALVVKKEYASPSDDEEKDAVSSLRETLPRFIGMVCVALSLEGLIMVIKYSQLELAGNLYYPVAIIASTALLLTALGLFIYLTGKGAIKEL